MPTCVNLIADGPLTLTPALTRVTPEVFELDQFGRALQPAIQAAGTALVPVNIGNMPGNDGMSRSFRIDGPTDMGKWFTQEQIQGWHELKLAIDGGFVTATVEGTVPWQPGP